MIKKENNEEVKNTAKKHKPFKRAPKPKKTNEAPKTKTAAKGEITIKNAILSKGKKPTKPQANTQKHATANKQANTQKQVPANKQATATKQSTKHTKTNAKRKRSEHNKKTPLRIIPLGGLNEIGKNITLYECGQDMFIVDCGLAFPDADMLGVDLVIPDFTYLEKNADKIRGLVITHGHEDHIGSIPYLLKKINVPIYATRLAIGLIEGKLKEHGLLGRVSLNVISPKETVKMGCMSVEFIRVNHSIPDSVALAIHTPTGVVVQTGDFKVDYTPIEGDVIDLAKFAQLGKKGVLCLLSDSTNAERPGSTVSEAKVGQSLNTLFSTAWDKRIIIATFASNIHRIQQIIDNAHRYNRKVAVSGRSMINVVGKAVELGYLNIPDNLLIDLDEVSRYPNEKVVLITTGSQGEPLSALSRMASGEHRKITVTTEDLIIISATPIPGNEKHVTRVINELLKIGADVIYDKMYEVHVSGHACADELKLMLTLTKPRFFIPVHGEYKHLRAHAKLAVAAGVEQSHIHVGEVGQVIELDNVDMKVVSTVESGGVFVDGLGVGDVGSIVLRDRKKLAQDGLIIVVATIEKESRTLISGPDIVSRGFVYVRESEKLMNDSREVVKQAIDRCIETNVMDWTSLKLSIKDSLSGFIYKKTKRSPMILPIIMEI